MAYLSGTSEIQKKSRKFTKSRVPCEPLGITCPNKYLYDQCHESYLRVKYEALMFRNAKNKFFKKKVKKRAQNGTDTRQTDKMIARAGTRRDIKPPEDMVSGLTP